MPFFNERKHFMWEKLNITNRITRDRIDIKFGFNNAFVNKLTKSQNLQSTIWSVEREQQREKGAQRKNFETFNKISERIPYSINSNICVHLANKAHCIFLQRNCKACIVHLSSFPTMIFYSLGNIRTNRRRRRRRRQQKENWSITIFRIQSIILSKRGRAMHNIEDSRTVIFVFVCLFSSSMAFIEFVICLKRISNNRASNKI